MTSNSPWVRVTLVIEGDGDGCTGTDRLELQVPPSADLGQRLADLYYRAFHALNRARARRQQVSPDQQGEKT